MKAILAILVAALIVLAAAEGNNTSDLPPVTPETSDEQGLNPEIVKLVNEAEVDISVRFNNTLLTDQERADIQQQAEDTVNGILDLINIATAKTIKTNVAGYQAQVDAVRSAYVIARNQTIQDLNGNYSAWQERVANLTAAREAAQNVTGPEGDKILAALQVNYVKLVERVGALSIALARAWDQENELKFKLATGLLIYANQTIYDKNASLLEIQWTPVNKTALRQNITKIAVMIALADARIAKIIAEIPKIKAKVQEALDEIRQKARDFANNVYAKLQELKEAWKNNATAVAQEIAERVNDFLENANQTNVTVDLSDPEKVKIAISIVYDDASSSVAAVKDAIKKGVRIVLAAVAGAKSENVTVDVTESAKRAAGVYSASSSIGQAQPLTATTTTGSAVTGSAASVVLAVGAVIAALVALLF